MKLCPKCGCLSYFDSYFQRMMCNTCEHTWKEEKPMAKEIMDHDEVKAIIEQLKTEKAKLQLQLDKVLEAIEAGVPCPNAVSLQNTEGDCEKTGCGPCWRQALDAMGGQLTPSEVVDLHTDGTLCNQCGIYMGEAVGYARLCGGCEIERLRHE